MKSLLNLDAKALQDYGICDWGYTEEYQAKSYAQFDKWTQNNCTLTYLTDERKNKRENLKLIFPEVQSALVFHFSYAEVQKQLKNDDIHQIAGYALAFEGEDYHLILRERLHAIAEKLNLKNYKSTLDIEPLLERDLSYRAGLGWFGKNAMLISQKEGSYFIIGSLLLSQKLDFPQPHYEIDHCGHCTLCIEACPTQALDPNSRTLKVDLCLSTYTIELRKELSPPEGFEKSRGEIFGCDICQDVCPWNKKKLAGILPSLLSKRSQEISDFFNRTQESLFKELTEWSGKKYERIFKKSALMRPGLKGMLKNIKFLKHSH